MLLSSIPTASPRHPALCSEGAEAAGLLIQASLTDKILIRSEGGLHCSEEGMDVVGVLGGDLGVKFGRGIIWPLMIFFLKLSAQSE